MKPELDKIEKDAKKEDSQHTPTSPDTGPLSEPEIEPPPPPGQTPGPPAEPPPGSGEGN